MSSEEAIARIAPELLERFRHRGIIEVHELLKNPPTLLVSVQYLGERSRPDDLNLLWSLAANAGLTVEHGYNFEETLAIEISLSRLQDPPQFGVVVPFRRRGSGRLCAIS